MFTCIGDKLVDGVSLVVVVVGWVVFAPDKDTKYICLIQTMMKAELDGLYIVVKGARFPFSTCHDGIKPLGTLHGDIAPF